MKYLSQAAKELTDTSEYWTDLSLYFRLGAESYSSLGPVGKKEKKIAWDILAKFACGQVSSPRLHRLKSSEGFFYFSY